MKWWIKLTIPFTRGDDDVEITLEVFPSNIPVRGASGDPDHDKAVEDRIIADLEKGREWVWCDLLVTAEWKGIKGIASLSAAQFSSPEDYERSFIITDLEDEALAHLTEQVEEIVNNLFNDHFEED